MYRLLPTLVNAILHLGELPNARLFGNRRDWTDLRRLLVLHNQLPFDKFPQQWRSRATASRRSVFPGPEFGEVGAYRLPFCGWTTRVLPNFNWAHDFAEPVNRRIIPERHLRGVASISERDADGLDSRKGMVSPSGSDCDPKEKDLSRRFSVLPKFGQGSKFLQDGSLKEGQSVRGEDEWHGHPFQPMLGPDPAGQASTPYGWLAITDQLDAQSGLLTKVVNTPGAAGAQVTLVTENPANLAAASTEHGAPPPGGTTTEVTEGVIVISSGDENFHQFPSRALRNAG